MYLCVFLRNYGHAVYENRVSQSHDEEEGCVHNDVYTVNPCFTCWVWAPGCTRSPPPIRRRQTKRWPTAANSTDMRVERNEPSDLTNSRKGGEASRIRNGFKSEEEGGEISLFLISRPKKIGLEDTAGRKFQSEAELIRSIQDALISLIKVCK